MKKTFQVQFIPVLISSCAALSLVGCGSGASKSIEEVSAKPNSVIEVPSGSTILIGRGFNSVRAEVLSNCVKNGALTTIGGSGQNTEFVMKQIETIEDLKESLAVSASGSFGYGLYKGSAKASFMKSKDFSSNSSYLMVSVKVSNQTETLEKYEFTDEARALLKANKRTEFLNRCGDEFFAAKTTGGEFTAIVEFKSKTEQEKQDISASIKASGGTWKVATDFKSAMEKLSKVSETKVTILREGGSGELPNFDNLVQAALKFPAEITQTNAWPYTVTTIPYAAVSDQDPNLARPLVLRDAQRFFDDVSRAFMSLIKVRNDVSYVLYNRNQYPDIDVNALNAAKNSLDAEIRRVESAPNRCFDAPEIPENSVAVDYTIPQISFPKRFSDERAVCTFKTEKDFREGKFGERSRLGLIESNSVRLFKPDGDSVDVPCHYYVTLI